MLPSPLIGDADRNAVVEHVVLAPDLVVDHREGVGGLE